MGVLQSAVGHAQALTGTVAVAGAAAVAIAWFLCRSTDPYDCADPVPAAMGACCAGTCAC